MPKTAVDEKPGKDLSAYWKHKRKLNKLALEYTQNMDKEKVREKLQSGDIDMLPTICISRKIGVGALEFAELLSARLGFRVIDREIIEEISDRTELSRSSIATFDERYPGKIREFLGLMLGDRTFGLDAYARHLFVIACILASMENTIFVGRGIHLMLPRQKVFAIRCISSIERRARRLGASLKVSRKKAEQIMSQADAEQKEFFAKVHGKDDAAPAEFDMTVNLDYLTDINAVVDATALLFKSRFPGT
jgi:cytidylate kinase